MADQALVRFFADRREVETAVTACSNERPEVRQARLGDRWGRWTRLRSAADLELGLTARLPAVIADTTCAAQVQGQLLVVQEIYEDAQFNYNRPRGCK